MSTHTDFQSIDQDTQKSINQPIHQSMDQHDSEIDQSVNQKVAVVSPQFSIKPAQSINLMELVQGLTSAVGENLDLSKLHSLMSSYDQSINEWRRFAFFDPTKKYTRNLIATDHTYFSLMLLCWNPQQESPVHNHSGSECFMRVIEGSVQECQYEYYEDKNQPINQSINQSITQTITQNECDEKGTPLKLLRSGSYDSGAVLFINDSIGLHKIHNVTQQPAVTLHCYLPPYEECNCYEEQTGKSKKAFTTFYSEHGELLEHQ